MKNLRHSAIIVSDINKARYFYEHLLGLHLIVQKTLSSQDIVELLGLEKQEIELTYYKLATDKGYSLVELYHFSKIEQMLYNGINFNHLAFTVDNVDKLYKDLKMHDINVLSKPKIMGTCKIFFARDFDRNMIELVEELDAKKKK